MYRLDVLSPTNATVPSARSTPMLLRNVESVMLTKEDSATCSTVPFMSAPGMPSFSSKITRVYVEADVPPCHATPPPLDSQLKKYVSATSTVALCVDTIAPPRLA